MSKQLVDPVTEDFHGEGAIRIKAPLIIRSGTGEYNRNMIAGVALTPEGYILAGGSKEHYELWVGDIILVPEIKLTECKESGLRVDQMLCLPGWQHKDNWGRELWRKGK